MKLFLKIIKYSWLGFVYWTIGCGDIAPDNIYGRGYIPSAESPVRTDNQVDYITNQSQFMTISVDQVLYHVTDTLSYITLGGKCFNPGFETTTIFYRAYDANSYDLASDGLPYLTNVVYVPGTKRRSPSTLRCDNNNRWSTVVEVPTALLYQLDQGNIEVYMVAWYKTQELTNPMAGRDRVLISPPDLQTEQ